MNLTLKVLLLTPIYILILLVISSLAAVVITVALVGLILTAPTTILKGLKTRQEDKQKLLYRKD